MKRRGRPVLGAIAGLLLGAFVAIDLMMFKVHRLDDVSVFGLPAIGLVLGILLGVVAPFGRSGGSQEAEGPTWPPAQQETPGET